MRGDWWDIWADGKDRPVRASIMWAAAGVGGIVAFTLGLNLVLWFLGLAIWTPYAVSWLLVLLACGVVLAVVWWSTTRW